MNERAMFFLRLRILLAIEILIFVPFSFALLLLGGWVGPEKLLQMQSSFRKRLVFSKAGDSVLRQFYIEYHDLRLSKRLRSRDL